MTAVIYSKSNTHLKRKTAIQLPIRSKLRSEQISQANRRAPARMTINDEVSAQLLFTTSSAVNNGSAWLLLLSVK